MNVLATSFSSLQSRIKKRTPLERYLIIALLLFFFVIIGLIIAVSLSPRKEKSPVCQTSACYAVGTAIRSSLDLNVDPCKDFYSYCCGGWEKSHKIPQDMNKYGAIEEIKVKVLSKLKDSFEHINHDGVAAQNTLNFYQSCMNTSAIEIRGASPLLEFLAEFGGWPVIDPKWQKMNFNCLSELAKIQLKTGYGYILPVIVATDPKNTTRKLLQIDQPSLLISESILKDKEKESSKKDLNNFETFFSKIAKLLGSTNNNFTTDINSIVDFETKMLQIMSTPEDMSDINYWYNSMSVSDLQRKVPQIEWLRYLQELTNSSLMSLGKGGIIQDDDVIIVRDLPYVNKIVEYLRKESNSRQISTYLGWRVIMSLTLHMPNNFSVALQDYYRDSGYPMQVAERWKTCINRINSMFSYVAAFTYVKDYFPADVRKEVMKLVLDLSFQFESMLLNSDWMDKKTKIAALQKLRAMKYNVGYPDWVADENHLDEFYIKNQMPLMTESVFENDLKLMEHRTMQVIKTLRINPQKEEWPISPITINAAYNLNLNSITFPAAFLQLPLYNSSLPSYFNYAAIGSIIGHEITHGFDSEGSKRNASGEIFNWWGDETKLIFEDKANCFIQQYNHYGLDGIRTLAENIADNGGLRQAHAAFKYWKSKELSILKLPGLEEFSIDQIFFIIYGSIWCTKYADGILNYTIRDAEHAPSPYRLKITTANFKAFSESFNCDLNTLSNLKNNCSIW